ncbi:hypothetical protein BGZ76_000391 [Entomortierella beljakovae]|nr:hypothetical protein BGZ76_000391 [Entomortierella beljakovae]
MNREFTAGTTTSCPVSESTELSKGPHDTQDYNIQPSEHVDGSTQRSSVQSLSYPLQSNASNYHAMNNEPSLFPIISFPVDLSPDSTRRVYDETLEIMNRGVEEQRRLRQRHTHLQSLPPVHDNSIEVGSPTEQYKAESEGTEENSQ